MKIRGIKKSKRGLEGAVTALILVIAAVIISIVLVGFVFGIFGAFGGTPQVQEVGAGTINPSNGVATFLLRSSGNVKIVAAQLVGTTYTNFTVTVNGVQNGQVTVGINTVTVQFSGAPLEAGATYVLTLALSDGASVQVSVLAE